MKALISIFFLLSLAACSKDHDQKIDVRIVGTEMRLFQTPLAGNAVESSLVLKDGQVQLLTDQGMDGNLSLNGQTVGAGYRFSYIFEYQGTYYNFFQKDGNIDLSQSTDLVNWSESYTVLHATTGNFAAMWNPGVTVDDNGTWHMLIECNATGDNSHAGLCYATSSMVNGTLNFDNNKFSNLALTFAGNPWLQYIPGKGILVVYGRIVDGTWETHAGKLIDGTVVESDKFRVSQPGVHICDPSLVETDSGVYMTVSFDQMDIFELRMPGTLSELFDNL